MKRDIMSRIATLALAAVAAGFGAVSCAEEEIEVEAPMQKVTFAAASVYDNLPSTRTIYSGDEIEINGQKTERIDWVNGDRIYVRGLTCDQYIHPYSGGELTVASHQTLTGDSKVSVATLEGDANIHWAPNETNVFVAAYPSSTFYWETDSQISPRFMGYLPATQAQSASHTAGGQTVTNPSMDYAAMVAKESVTERPTDPVTLHFYPAFTAFEFNMAFAGASGSNTISKFEIESTTSALTGSWEWNYADGVNSFTCSTATTDNKKITVNFNNQVIDATHPLRFTVFALPQQITNVTVKFYLSSGTKTLSLKDKTTGVWEVFEPCKKYRISTPGAPSDWEYVIECTDPSAVAYTGVKDASYTGGTVTSYKYNGTDVEANRVPVVWKVEGYYTDPECTTPYEGGGTAKPYWMPGYDGSTGQDEAGPGSKTGEDVGITYAHSRGDTTETITNEARDLNRLIYNKENPGTTPVIGTSGSPYNLSNPQNNGAAGYVAESANSYIVNACGYYAIPLVMGNGVKNNVNAADTTFMGVDGSTKPNRILGKSSWGSNYYKVYNDHRVLYKNYKGNNITNPWLNQQGGTPTSAEIVWEDIEGLIETQKEGGANTYDLPAGCISSDGKWLYFHVPTVREGKYIYKDAAGNVRNEPRQGNAVIAVKDASGNVMWSYHIWVTDYIPKNYRGYNNDYVDLRWPFRYQYPKSATTANPTDWVDVNNDYRHITRHLGRTVYGQTVTRDYPVNTVYVKLRQNDGVSTLTTVMTVVQLEGTENDVIDRSQPFFQHGRNTAFWPANGIDNTEPTWYGKTPRLNTTPTTNKVTMAYSIKNPDKFITSSDGTIVFSGTPTNLFNAFQQEPHDPYEIMAHVSNPGGLDYFKYYHPSFYVNEKTIFDPNPAGYSLVGYTVRMCYRYLNGTLSHNGVDLGEAWHGTQNQIIGPVSGGLSTYTHPTHDNAHKFTYQTTGLRNEDGSLTSVTTGTAFISDDVYITNNTLWAMIVGTYDINSNPTLNYLRLYGAAPVMPFDDGIRRNKAYVLNPLAFFNQTEPVNYSPSSSFTYGRFTVMQDDPQLQ